MGIVYVWIFLILFNVLSVLVAAVFIFWIAHLAHPRRKKREQTRKFSKAE
jgi:predicted membrane protein